MELKFDDTEEEKYIVSYLLRDQLFFLKVSKYLATRDWTSKQYFQDAKLQFILNSAIKYQEKYKSPITEASLKILARKTCKDDEALRIAMDAKISELYKIKDDEISPQYLQERTVKFIRTQRAVEATVMNQQDIINGNFDLLSKRIEDAVSISIDKDFGMSLNNAEETIANIKTLGDEKGNITWGSSGLDNIMGKANGGELCCFLGVPGVGKTLWLGNVAIKNFIEGKKVFFVSLEVDKRRLAVRLYQSLLHKTGRELLDIEVKEVEEQLRMINPENKGDILIKNFGANSASSNDISAVLRDLKATKNWIPDVIIIDYMLITASNDGRLSRENPYTYYKAVSEEMRNIAFEFNCPVFTACQLNRGAMSEKGGGSKATISTSQISESKGIVDTCDYIVGIVQTEDQKYKKDDDTKGTYRIVVGKNRNGETGRSVDFEIDWNYMALKEIIGGKK